MAWREPKERSPHSSCNKCDAPITWMKTYSEKNIAVDRDSLPVDWEPGQIYDKQKGMKCHFDTCAEKD